MKWLVFGIGVVVLGVLVLVYEFSGIKYYWEMSDFVSSQKVEEKMTMEREVFGNSGPKYFHRADYKSVFFFYDQCSQKNLERYV
jgi:hypothetical protein